MCSKQLCRVLLRYTSIHWPSSIAYILNRVHLQANSNFAAVFSGHMLSSAKQMPVIKH